MTLWIVLGGGFLFVVGFVAGVFCERRHWNDVAEWLSDEAEREAAARIVHLPRAFKDN